MSREITLTVPEVATETLGFFRFKHLPSGKVALTNEIGEFELLAPEDFDALLEGRVRDELKPALADKGILREGADWNAIAGRLARKKAFLSNGPHLHAVVTTLRCNQSCSYCHASRTDMDRVDTDMSVEVAKKVVDFAMQSPSAYINFEFQGGEPTIRFDILQFVVQYAREKNRYEKKTLDFSLVTNMTYMDEDKAEWLIQNDVLVCTSLDGPKDVHDANRGWAKGSGAYDTVLKWMGWFNARYIELGRDPDLWHVDALMTTTRRSLDRYKEIIDLYVSLGIRNIHLRPLNPFGFANKTWNAIGYSMDEFMDFYVKALDYILELNASGTQIMEGRAAVFLSKMLTPDSPLYVDIRSPIGSGTGQLAYSYDGRIYPSDEGRMVAAQGDEFFHIGDVDMPFSEVVQHPTVKAIAVASIVDSLPGCSTCFNAPWCGVRPLHNYMQAGDLFGQRPNTPKCKQHMDISTLLLDKLAQDEDGSIERIFRRWTIHRPRHEAEETP